MVNGYIILYSVEDNQWRYGIASCKLGCGRRKNHDKLNLKFNKVMVKFSKYVLTVYHDREHGTRYAVLQVCKL